MSNFHNETIKESLFEIELETLNREGWDMDDLKTYEEAYRRTKKAWVDYQDGG